MCGICGFIGKGNLQTLRRMTSDLTHRGPDAEGIWHDELKGIYLGHRRLSIIDIAGGIQPMWSSDGEIGVIFNGEIYNHIELRKTLQKKGYIFQSDHSDTEVLLYGFREWGTALPEYLNGMWAFTIYDKSQNILFLSRDRFGKKPLFYTLQNQNFVFASELSALVKYPFAEASVSVRSLKKYFAYGYIPAPNSFYTNIHKLPGGYNLLFDIANCSLRVWKYWEFILEPFETIPKHPEQEWGEQLRELLKKAVDRRLMSDVPLGVFLSGGIDSSAITAFASQSIGRQNLRTFSIGFQEATFDESDYARTVSELFQTNHHLKILSIEKARELLPTIISCLDEPMGDSSLLPTYLLSRETRKYVTVALGGDGGDELFAGYDPFHALRLAEFYDRVTPKPVHEAIRIAMSFLPVSHKYMSLDFRIKRTLRGLSYPKHLWCPVWLGNLESSEINELFQEPTDLEDIYSEAIEYWNESPQNNLTDKTLQFFTKLYLQDNILVKVDRASMMNSLEVRAPFLDIEFVDFVRRIPNNWKYRNGETKYILKKALETVLPKNILYRKKQGFGIPVGKWFREDLIRFDKFDIFNFLNKDFIIEKLGNHQNMLSDERLFLWNMWLLSKWI